MSANIFVGAKHDRCKSLVITNKLSAVMLRLCKIHGCFILVTNHGFVGVVPRAYPLRPGFCRCLVRLGRALTRTAPTRE